MSIDIHLKLLTNVCVCAIQCIFHVNRDIEFAIKMHLIQFIYDMNIEYAIRRPLSSTINQSKLRRNYYLDSQFLFEY